MKLKLFLMIRLRAFLILNGIHSENKEN